MAKGIRSKTKKANRTAFRQTIGADHEKKLLEKTQQNLKKSLVAQGGSSLSKLRGALNTTGPIASTSTVATPMEISTKTKTSTSIVHKKAKKAKKMGQAKATRMKKQKKARNKKSMFQFK
eukprot:CAMPEP_0113934150 /NCGR_PEP_ID=MMETSP1339-20121228/1482_1 /TAXON_ID=94617 /ORGANISM="Fibrocapsa japonica" /LENGTH=119 /DNA_ID=CAMNT_0000935823 /DNA_START=23 /DNA_END=382 /DNA_ORIENTATION=+ /assembly_acc=CAM_ASM_000762